MAHELVPICCQREAEGFCNGRDCQFQSAATFVLIHDPNDRPIDVDPISDSEKTSPLAFLATVANADADPSATKWNISISEGKEKITVVPGPLGLSIRLHKGNGRLPPMDLTKPFAKKCRNRECNNLGGQLGKPRSIYCSKRCQSREQNLRQGRIKNVRSPTPTSLAGTKRSNSPRSSPSPVSMLGTSSPVPMAPSSPAMSSPLTLRVGMSPSPISLSPVPLGSTYPTSFSPIPMSSSIPVSSHVSTPILLPRPTQPSAQVTTTTQFTKPTATKPSAPPGSISSSFSPAPQQKKFESMESLTLAPILSST